MPTHAPEGDVYVSPVYLAGSTFSGDPALQPLLDQGFLLHCDELANVYASSPEQHLRLGYLPEGENSTLWKIAARPDLVGPPRWIATFDDNTPTELFSELRRPTSKGGRKCSVAVPVSVRTIPFAPSTRR
ncbi:DUF317 domain-containing protein [Streptomyces lydicus]|uniref:DUF317 domain-containing protein n=1 Tax=Streptomyces lydicus TaxID=47763 RepID=UPI0037ACF5A3